MINLKLYLYMYYMKYIYITGYCFWCGKTNYYSYLTYNKTYCYICKNYTDLKFKDMGKWCWA
jgi:hypothetical protein